ncbi:hypothetical protein DFS33DRAFT_1364644 [Desarmillaria ectypa]|nr:hypothetical protein DFS33DRAFT_1364644 [Desarmillaria ectypa]
MLTSRPISRNNDLAGQRQMLSKTPGRVFHQNENAYRGPATVHGKGKNTLLQTPFNGGKFNKEGTQGKLTTQAPLRPLVDKTPFPNRSGVQFQTPYAFNFDKFSSPDSILRPSSLRRHVRVPRSATKSFETPVNTGNPWQCDVSIGSPEIVVQQLVMEDDLDEIEYMPPNTLDMPYVPPFNFEFPDYKSVGKTLLEITRAPLYEAEPPPLPEVKDDELDVIAWDRSLPLPELDDDPKRIMRKNILPNPNSASSRITTRTVGKAMSATKYIPNPSIRTGTAASTRSKPTALTSKATSRLGTAASVRQPQVVPTKNSRPATSQSITTTSARSRVVPARPTWGTQSRAVRKPTAPLRRAPSATNVKPTVKKPTEDPLIMKLDHDVEDFMFAV